MQTRRNKEIDILCVGELLVDLMTTDYADKIDGNRLFKPVQGGSPANLCLNMARLNNQVQLVCTVGSDGLGDFLLNSVRMGGVDCSLVHRSKEPTTIILVSHSLNLPSFEAYRTADKHITMDQMPSDILEKTNIFHTTCFGMSLAPAQDSIMEVARKAKDHHLQLSIDANYAQKVWPNQQQAQELVAEYVSYGALVKVSEVDWQRLYNQPLERAETAAEHFLKLGAKQVCVTLGAEGAYIATTEEAHFLPARSVTVRDTTGAGDAFWSGFLTAYLDGNTPLNCLKAGRKMAEIKLEHLGPLQRKVDKKEIYVDV